MLEAEDHHNKDINSYCVGEGNKKSSLYFNQENCKGRIYKMIDKWRKYMWSLRVNVDLIAHKIDHKMSQNFIFIIYNSEKKNIVKNVPLLKTTL